MPGGRTVTLAQLRADARLYADQRATGTDQFLTDAEVDRLINQACAELYGTIVQARGDEELLSSEQLTTTVNDHLLSLVNPFWQIVSVSIPRGDETEFIEHSPSVRHWIESRALPWGDWSPKFYRVVGDHGLDITPKPRTVETVDVVYIPPWTDLVLDTDTWDGVNGWEKAVALKVAMEMRAIEESPTEDLERRYAEIWGQIEQLAADRAAVDPEEVQDVHPHTRYGRRSRLYNLGRP